MAEEIKLFLSSDDDILKEASSQSRIEVENLEPSNEGSHVDKCLYVDDVTFRTVDRDPNSTTNPIPKDIHQIDRESSSENPVDLPSILETSVLIQGETEMKKEEFEIINNSREKIETGKELETKTFEEELNLDEIIQEEMEELENMDHISAEQKIEQLEEEIRLAEERNSLIVDEALKFQRAFDESKEILISMEREMWRVLDDLDEKVDDLKDCRRMLDKVEEDTKKMERELEEEKSFRKKSELYRMIEMETDSGRRRNDVQDKETQTDGGLIDSSLSETGGPRSIDLFEMLSVSERERLTNVQSFTFNWGVLQDFLVHLRRGRNES